MATYHCSVCAKVISAGEAKKCGNCKFMNSDYLLCSKSCQKDDYKRHKKEECLHPNYDCPAYKECLEKGYEWHKEEKGEDAMPWNAWVKNVNNINKNIDNKIPFTHGYTYWNNGDRRFNGILNVEYRHVCDVLALLGSLDEEVDKTDFADGLSQQEIDFVKDNVDFLWVQYHDINSKLPMIMIPPGKHSREIYSKPGFRDKQQAKRDKNMQNPFETFMVATAARNGLIKGPK